MAIVPRKFIVIFLCVVAPFAMAGAQKKAKKSAAQNKPAATAEVLTVDTALRYRNPNLSIEDRVADLMPRMTLEE
jgi:hypothetical protein